MEEEKRNRVAAAITVNAIILAVVLVAVLVYQIITLAVVSARKRWYLAEIEKYEKLLQQSESDLEYLQSEQYLLELALQYGYYFPNG